MMKLYNLDEASELLHMSPETLRKKVQPHGTWPARRIGKRILFTEADLEAIVELAGQTRKRSPRPTGPAKAQRSA